MKILYEQKGFFQLELLLLTSIVISLVMVWFSLGLMINQQRNNSYHMTAIFLAQGYLNLIEKNKIGLIPEKIECNHQNYRIKVEDTLEIENMHCFKINIEWNYNGKTENEVLQRWFIK